MDKINYSYFLTDGNIFNLIKKVDSQCELSSISSSIDDSEGTRVYINVNNDPKKSRGYLCILNNCSMEFLFYPERIEKKVKTFDQKKYIKFLYNHLGEHASDWRKAYISEKYQALLEDFKDKPSKLVDYLLSNAIGSDGKDEEICKIINGLDEQSKKSLLLVAINKELDDILSEKEQASEPNNE